MRNAATTSSVSSRISAAELRHTLFRLPLRLPHLHRDRRPQPGDQRRPLEHESHRPDAIGLGERQVEAAKLRARVHPHPHHEMQPLRAARLHDGRRLTPPDPVLDPPPHLVDDEIGMIRRYGHVHRHPLHPLKPLPPLPTNRTRRNSNERQDNQDPSEQMACRGARRARRRAVGWGGAVARSPSASARRRRRRPGTFSDGPSTGALPARRRAINTPVPDPPRGAAAARRGSARGSRRTARRPPDRASGARRRYAAARGCPPSPRTGARRAGARW